MSIDVQHMKPKKGGNNHMVSDSDELGLSGVIGINGGGDSRKSNEVLKMGGMKLVGQVFINETVNMVADNETNDPSSALEVSRNQPCLGSSPLVEDESFTMIQSNAEIPTQNPQPIMAERDHNQTCNSIFGEDEGLNVDGLPLAVTSDNWRRLLLIFLPHWNCKRMGREEQLLGRAVSGSLDWGNCDELTSDVRALNQDQYEPISKKKKSDQSLVAQSVSYTTSPLLLTHFHECFFFLGLLGDKNRSWAVIASERQPREELKMNFYRPEVNSEGISVVYPPLSLTLEGRRKWENCLVGSFVKKKPAFLSVQYLAMKMWNKYRLSEVMMNERGFFFFIFKEEEAMLKCLEEGPWLFQHHPILLQRWQLEIELNKESP
ncbi:hypothetical protein Pint_05720 [Pistacia integerrima]|uniref:Uncharacterized protein n=1 Tax=Pistacia integerrima TaxID=434235 RepID=A0ACC0Z3V8_9ROSI|nr:hypothetical protein Pint_05720 [Pistacia integerrima]